MAAPKKTAAKKATAPRVKVNPVLDFESLTVEDTDSVKHSRIDLGPVLEWVRESYEYEQGKAVVVPSGDGVRHMEQLLRKSASELNIGVTIVKVDHENGTTTVKFLGKDRRQYSKGDEAETEDE